jgi:hypothetical protein
MYVYTITTSWYYKDVCKKVDNKPINAHFLPIVRNRIRIGKMDVNMMILVDRTNQNIDGKRGISTHQR